MTPRMARSRRTLAAALLALAAPTALAAARAGGPEIQGPAGAAAPPALASAPATAPGSAAEALTLADAVALARRSHPALLAARHRAEAAAAEAAVARRAAGWPRLAVTGAWTATDQPAAVFAQRLDAGVVTDGDFAVDRLTGPSYRSHLASSIGVELPLDLFGKAAPARASAESAARAAGEGAREAELEVVLGVTAAWNRALVAGEAVRATERAVAGSAAREREVAAQADEGAALRADLLRVRARRRHLEAQLASRRGERQTALAALALAVGAGRPVAPAGVPAVPAPPVDLGAWLARGEGRPAVAAARSAAASAAELARARRRDDRPDLLLSAQLRDDRGPVSEGQASGLGGVFVRWSPFDPQRAPRRQAADRAAEAAAADAEAVAAEAGYEIEAAWHGAVAAHERWLAARGGTDEGQEALRVVRERRQAGLATLTDELETEAAALMAELDELAAAAAAAEARATLERAAGASAPLETPR